MDEKGGKKRGMRRGIIGEMRDKWEG
jgi:hypothetical protein